MPDFSQIAQLAAQLLMRQNPNVSNNPQAANWLNVIQSGDQNTGERIAQNILDSYGLTREQGVEMAKKFFHLR